MKECEYKGNFDSWESVVRNFKGSFLKKDLPTEVLYANYDTPPYEGEALVIWRKGRKYYLLHGSHCSCYGQEARVGSCQWRWHQRLERIGLC